MRTNVLVRRGAFQARPVQAALALGVAAMGTAGLLGCSDPDSKSDLNFEGPPDIVEVTVRERLNEMTGEPALLSDPQARVYPMVAYGCDMSGETGRNTFTDIVSFYCEDKKPGNHLIPPDDGVVTMASIGGGMSGQGIESPAPRIRVIFDELLAPENLEQFACACNDTSANAAFLPNCAGSPLYAPLAQVLSVCADNPDTPINETGQFLDTNFDGVPDDSVLFPGIVSLNCVSSGGVASTWTNDEFEGFWNPSGNQAVPIDLFTFSENWEGIGPAFVLQPRSIPSDSTCTLAFADTVVDKDGEPVPQTDASFQTEPLQIDGMPSAGAAMIVTKFNAPVDPASVAGSVTLTTAAGATVPGTATTTAEDPFTVVFTPATPLVAGSYLFNISTGLTDSYGVPIPAPIMFPFTRN